MQSRAFWDAIQPDQLWRTSPTQRDRLSQAGADVQERITYALEARGDMKAVVELV